jgi:nucleotide sugar dehydrogenase
MSITDEHLDYQVVVFGLGFVGLTLSVTFADAGLNVLGIDLDQATVAKLRSGRPHFYEQGLKESLNRGLESGKLEFDSKIESSPLKRAYIVAVGTPLKGNQLDKSSIKNVVSSICKTIKPDDLVILRSTVSIGMTAYIRDEIRKKIDFNFEIAMCPERTLEGIALLELRTLPQVIGAPERESRQSAARLFETITPHVVEVHSYEAAEMTKLANNIVRDVKFALANEIAFACESVNIDFQEVRRASTLGYPRDGLAQAGPVAGPCLEKDSWIFLESLGHNSPDRYLENSVIRNARLINESIPTYVSERLMKFYKGDFAEIPTLHLGVAFKGTPPTDDIRGSDSLKVIRNFKDYGTEQYAVDFEVSEEILQELGVKTDTSPLFKSSAASIIIYNNHEKNRSFILNCIDSFQKSSQVFILDLWNLFDSSFVWPSNFHYQSLGNI